MVAYLILVLERLIMFGSFTGIPLAKQSNIQSNTQRIDLRDWMTVFSKAYFGPSISPFIVFVKE